jgi:hypothetical protein
LFVFAVQQDDFHDEVLVQTEERSNLRVLLTLPRSKALPGSAMLPQSRQGLIQPRGESLTQLLELEIGRFFRIAQGMVLPLH